MNAPGLEIARLTLHHIQDITSGNIIKNLFIKRPIFYPNNARRLNVHLEIILENKEPRKAKERKNGDKDTDRDKQKGKEFKDCTDNQKSRF